MKAWLARLIVLLLFLHGVSDLYATNLPYVQKKNKSTSYLINTLPPTHNVFTLIKPKRLVIDQLKSSDTLRALQHFSYTYQKLPGIKAIRLNSQGKQQVRLVIEFEDDWPVVFKKYKNYAELEVRPPLKHPLNQLQPATAPIQLQPTTPSRGEARPEKKYLTVVIDPGHGGKDPGATGHQGTHEKYVVLKIARQLAALFNRSPRYHAILTRNDDRYIPLRQRLHIARHYHADLFISIHADAFSNTKARGSSVYALSQRGATSEAAHWLARNENASELMSRVELDNQSELLRSVLLNLSQTASVRDSLIVGSKILASLNTVNQLHHRRVEQAAFVVLKSPDIPSLLIETGFLSNRYEEKLLNSPTQQKRIAEAIFQGIDRYFKVYKQSP